MANETAYSYQAPDELVYNLLTGRGDQFGLLPTVADYYRSQFEQLGQADTNPFTYKVNESQGFLLEKNSQCNSLTKVSGHSNLF
jgi:hypothetical protein